MDIEQLIDAAARAAVEHDRLPDGAANIIAQIQQRPDGLYSVPDFARKAYRGDHYDTPTASAGAFRWFNNLMATITAEREAEAAGLTGAGVGIASTRAIAAVREKINAAIEAGNY